MSKPLSSFGSKKKEAIVRRLAQFPGENGGLGYLSARDANDKQQKKKSG